MRSHLTDTEYWQTKAKHFFTTLVKAKKEKESIAYVLALNWILELLQWDDLDFEQLNERDCKQIIKACKKYYDKIIFNH